MTLARPKAFSLGERAKKIPTDKGWDFEYWWWNTEPNPRSLSEADSNRTRKCPCFRAIVLFPSRALSTKGRRGLGWRARKQSLRRTQGRFRVSQSNRRPHFRERLDRRRQPERSCAPANPLEVRHGNYPFQSKKPGPALRHQLGDTGKMAHRRHWPKVPEIAGKRFVSTHRH